MWIYDLTILSKSFYDNVLRAYRNNRLHRVETPPDCYPCHFNNCVI